MIGRQRVVKKILILSANPIGTARLRLDEEVREIKEGLKRSKKRGKFKIHHKLAVGIRDIRRALLDYEPDILHFTGHGEKEGLLVEDEQGLPVRVDPKALSELFKLFSNQLECVVLSACYSGLQAVAINKHIKYVIGMEKKIKDKAALEFAVGFYDALGAGKSVEDSFKFGRNAILHTYPDLNQNVIPILKVGEGNSTSPAPPVTRKKKKHPQDRSPSRSYQHKKPSLQTTLIFAGIVLVLAVIILVIWKSSTNVVVNVKVNSLLAFAQSSVEEDPTLSLRLAERAWKTKKSQSAWELMEKIFNENNFYRILSTQEQPIASMKVSQDSRYFITRASDGTARLFERGGKLLRSFEELSGRISTAAFSADNHLIVFGCKDGTAHIWEINGKEKQIFKGHNQPLTCVAFSPDNQAILTGSMDNTIRLWNLENRKIQVFNGHTQQINAVVFSTDGRYILSGSTDLSARVWDLQSLEPTRPVQIIETGKRIYSVAFSPNNKTIATGLDDGIVGLWDWQGEKVAEFNTRQLKVYSVVFSADGDSILTGLKGNDAVQWDLEGNEIRRFKGHKGNIHSAVFVSNGHSVLTGSLDKTIRLWKLDATLQELLEDDGCQSFTDEEIQEYVKKNRRRNKMKEYYVNQNAQSTGEHEVHASDCSWLDKVLNKTYLGKFKDCSGAVKKAAEYYSNVDGCKHCSLDCHFR